MHSDEELLHFNNFIASRPSPVHWEIHSSQPGFDMDELFIQFADGSVLKISAKHREYGAAIELESFSRLPVGKPFRDLPREYEAEANSATQKGENDA